LFASRPSPAGVAEVALAFVLRDEGEIRIARLLFVGDVLRQVG
jgi:hypothetical protein